MEVSKKPWSEKKMVVKIGAGGGVGAVILLGGALATAALASAFIVGMKKRRSSSTKRRGDCQNPLPQPKQSEKDEATDEEQEFVFVDKLSSTEASKEVESDNHLLVAAQSLELDEKTEIDNDRRDVEQNGNVEIKGMNHEEAVELTEMGNRTEENIEVCCDQEESALTVVDKTLDEFHNDEMEAENNLETRTNIENDLGGDRGNNGETGEVKYEAVEKVKLDLVANTETHPDEGEVIVVDSDVERVNIDQMEFEENPIKDYGDTDLPVIESPVMEHKNVESNVKDGVLPTEMVDMSEEVISENQEVTKTNNILIEEHVDEVIQEDGVTEGVREDEVKYVVQEELLEEEQKEIDQPDEEILHKKSEEVNDEKSNNENELENRQLGYCDKNVENFGMPFLEKEMISHENIEFVENEEVPASLEVNKMKNLLRTSGKEAEDSSETIKIDSEESIGKEADLSETIDTDTAKSSIDLVTKISEKEKGESENVVEYEDEVDETDLSDEVEESSVGTGDSSTDSNSEAVWTAEESLETQKVKHIEQEVEGKTLEDKKLEAENESSEIKVEKVSQKATENSIKDDSISKNAIKKYFAELATVKDRPENATKKGILIVMIILMLFVIWVLFCQALPHYVLQHCSLENSWLLKCRRA